MTATLSADALKALLALQPHPEGGHFRETYRASEQVHTAWGPRAASTAILFLPSAGECPQHAVAAGHWFDAESVAGAAWSLVGCTVAPAFSFEDFELALPSQLDGHDAELRSLCGDWRRLCTRHATQQASQA